MRSRTVLILCFNLILGSSLFPQNIINTFGTSGTFTIKDASTTYFTLNQTDGTIQLPPVSGNTLRGAIFLGTDRFLHTYQSASSVGRNTFLGINSGNFNLIGSSLSGSENTGIGHESLTALTAGFRNSALGYQSLFSNTLGNDNCAFGSIALNLNTSGDFNSAVGSFSLNKNTTGSFNSGFGAVSLFDNISGSSNSAFGYNSLNNNSSGSNNSAFGNSSLLSNTTGIGNSALGNYSLRSCTGDNNTAIGDSSGRNITTGSNNITIGFNAIVPTPTGSNQVRMGNTSITFAGIQVAWTVSSDRNLKSNILNSDLGLSFINKLRPVSYTRINDESGKTEYGFIAQEVDETLIGEQNKNNGIISIDSEGIYSLRYNDLFAPMVKAIQELSEGLIREKQENEELRSKIESMKNVEERLEMLEKIIQNSGEFNDIKLTEK